MRLNFVQTSLYCPHLDTPHPPPCQRTVIDGGKIMFASTCWFSSKFIIVDLLDCINIIEKKRHCEEVLNFTKLVRILFEGLMLWLSELSYCLQCRHPYGHLLESQLFYFWSSFLLMRLRKQQWPKAWSLRTHRIKLLAYGLWLHLGPSPTV